MKTVIFFPLFAVAISFFAGHYPHYLENLQPAIIPLLGLVMFGMGMTLTIGDFRKVFTRPAVLALGLTLQFCCMPLIAWLLGQFLHLPLILTAGLVLVGACPGGTASNVICYLARGDVALSIIMTAIATLLAVILTPYLTWLYVGQKVPVPVYEMMGSIFRIIVLPVSLGVIVNHIAGRFLGGIKRFFPLISMMAIVLIIGIIVAINQPRLQDLIWTVIMAVILHNLLGLFAGYSITRLAGYDEKTARTIAIEVGMQNSGLGVALANKFFAPAAALPGAVFSIWHNISGAILAGFWSTQPRILHISDSR